MSGRDRGVQETAQQRELSAYALRQLRDYGQRWAPVQRNLAAHIQSMGAEGSREREAAAGKSSTDTAITFARAQGAVEKSLANQGIGPSSSRAKLATVGVGADEAKTRGIGAAMSDQMIDDAYTQGLAALTAIGRGERATVASGLEHQAGMSAREAATSAELSAANRAGWAGVAGQAAGAGIYGAMNKPADPGITVDYNGLGINNPNQQLPTAGGR